MTDEAERELKACPLCLSDQMAIAPDLEFGDITWLVICKACGCRVERDLEADAVSAWNTRSTDDLAVADERQCTCAAVAGEDPGCNLHGRGTLWLKENPDCRMIEDMRSDLNDAQAALGPFAEAAENYEFCDQHPGGCPDDALAGELPDLSVGDLRRARAALSKLTGGG